MPLSKLRFIFLGSAIALGGCSAVEDLGDMVWPSEEPPPPEVVQIPPAPGEQQARAPQQPGQPPQQGQYPPGQYPQQQGAYPPGQYPPPQYAAAPGQQQQPGQQPPGGPTPPPPLGTTSFEPTPPQQMPPTGTFVGGKIQQLRQDLSSLQNAISQHNGELQQIRNQMVQHSQGYHGIVAAINARLQVGTTPGNPVLVQQWNEAQAELDRLSNDVNNMNGLGNKAAADSAMAAYLLESTRAAYGLSGAVDEDHRQLAILEDEVNRTVVLIDRLLNELSEDVRRQTEYVGRERGNLQTLSLAIKNGELYGASLANRAYQSSAPFPGRAAADGTPTAGGRGGRPLVVIRFDRPDVEYEQALYSAVSRALERRPEAAFDVVAVTPQEGGPAKVALKTNKARRHAQDVLRSLSSMGLPPDRVNLSATTSANVSSNEVRVYVR